MKTRFNTYDIICNVTDLQRLIGLRVNQVYDIDNKTYLIRFQERDTKIVLLLESGNRFHTTAFEWPKNVAPNGFTMKLRKHLKNKRLEKFVQLGTDRIIDLQFGAGEAAYHIIVELYDRGNIILTDYELTILNILRPRVEGEELRFTVRQKYPENRAKENDGRLSEEFLLDLLQNAKAGDNLKKILNPVLPFGPAVIDHILTKHNLLGIKIPTSNKTDGQDEKDTQQENKGKKSKQKNKNQQNADASKRDLDLDKDVPIIMIAINDGFQMLIDAGANKSKGYIIQKREIKPSSQTNEKSDDFFLHNIEYHPYLFAQIGDQPYKEFDSFDAAVDEFYSTLEGQKIDVKAMQQEREALKKLQNVKNDHEKRLTDLSRTQIIDKQRAELITRNQELVESAMFAVRSLIANQLSWPEIHDLVKTAQKKGDAVASIIKHLKLETNHISLTLSDPYASIDNNDDDDDNDSNDDDDDPMNNLQPMTIDIDLGLSAYSNATRYYDQKRNAAKKEQRTIESSSKALKSAERKTQQTLKEVRLISTISKARKVYWFEKFYWFISSENYLVIGGRDQQQNEMIVKRYMRPTDIYVHAEIQGASSVVIRNPTGNDVPPKTLHEAGVMAISYSVAWDAKVVTNAYWVKSDQVSKTAPTGEYLGTGSFMIRGKKNFLPPCNLVLGLSLLFRLEDGSIARHSGERKVRNFDDDYDGESIITVGTESVKLDDVAEDDEIELIASDNEDGDQQLTKSKLDTVSEEEQQIVAIEDMTVPANDNDDDDDDENDTIFPDTHVKIEHDTGKVILQSDRKLETMISQDMSQPNNENSTEDAFIIHATAQRKVKQSKQKIERQNRKAGNKNVVAIVENEKDNDDKDETAEQKASQPKRRQKGKLKKIKEKYKDQDEEEKQIRMSILKSAGSVKSVKKATAPNEIATNTKKPVAKTPQVPKPQVQADGDDGGGGDDNAAVDVDMLDSLTGCPVGEDEILFAVPVIAPYQAMQNYKFKVKLMPGTGRRGRVAKTALLIFSKDKTCTQREKDLLKSVKDETIARNIPGNVKLSAPQMQKYKK